MRNSRIIKVPLLGFVLLLFVSQPAFAQKVTEQFKKPLKTFELMPKAEFQEQTSLISKPMTDDEAVSYQVRIPKNWKESDEGGFGNVAVSDKVLGELDKFYGPPTLTERSRVEVEAAGLDYKMTAEQWMIQYLLNNGYNLQGMKAHNNERAEALYVLLENSVSFAVRAVAHINGERILFAQYFVPLERYHDEKAMQVRILETFKPTKRSDEFVEDMEEFQFLDLAKVKFPVSWTLRALPIRSIDRMKVEILSTAVVESAYENAKTRLDGQIDIEMVSIFASDTLEEEIESYRADLAERGLVLGEVLERRDDFLFGDRFEFVDTQVYRVTNENNKLIEYEFWFTIMSAGDYYYFVSLFTASRDHDYLLWAKNSETYKLVASLVEPQVAANDTVEEIEEEL